MSTKIKDIVIPTTYEKDGETKTSWKNVGEYIEFTRTDGSGGAFIKLYMFPNVQFKVFDKKPKTAPVSAVGPKKANTPTQDGYDQMGGADAPANPTADEIDTIEYPEEQINASDIPF
jgi:hypothetical protein